MNTQKYIVWPHISQVVIGGASGVVLGVALMLWMRPSLEVVFYVCGIVGVVSVLFFYRSWRLWMFVVLLLGIVGGAVRSEHVLQLASTDRVGEKISDRVEVISVPRVSGRSLSARAQMSDGERVLVQFPKHADIVYGAYVDVTCTLGAPEVFNAFDYPRYLLMSRINYICKVQEYDVQGMTHTMLTHIAAVRRVLEGNIAQLMPAPESALANGLIFGGDDRLSQTLQDAFAQTGMSHIVAVSGYNVTIIVLAVTGAGIFVGLWRKQAALLSIVAVVVFVAMIGFPSSGVRAALMGTLVLFAVVYGRAAHAMSALVFTAACMLVWSPLQLRYDVGFQLSFLAVVGIMLFAPIFERFVTAQHKALGFTDILFLTISAQLFVLPVILFHFHTLSLSSLVTNMLILLILPITMLSTFLAAVISVISFVLAAPFAWIAYWLLAYEIFIIEFFAGQRWSSVQIDIFSFPLALLYYGVVLIVAYYFYRTYDLTRA